MRVTRHDHARGILDFSEGLRHFTLHRWQPSAQGSPWIDSYWVVAWELPEGLAHRQVNISHASVTIAFEPEGSLLYGVPGRTFVRVIRGSGCVFGIKFRPGGFYPFFGRSLRPLTGRIVAAADALGPVARGWLTAVEHAAGDEERVRLSDGFWSARAAGPPPVPAVGAPAATAAAETIIADRTILTVAAAATAAGVTVRTLQRLFRCEVGIGPKEVIRRYRLQEAAERLLREPSLACGELALAMGYFDQAHFIRDFKAVVGATPEVYRRRQRSTL